MKFKEKEKVYVYPQGWGTIDRLRLDSVVIKFDNGIQTACNKQYVSFTKYNLEDGGFSQVRPELEIGKSYRNNINATSTIINRRGNGGNYGFNHGYWSTGLCCMGSNWQEIPESEAIELLKKECVRRHGENWKDVKIKKCLFGAPHSLVNNGRFFSVILVDKIWNHNGCIFKDGVWAEKIEEPRIKDGDMIWVRDDVNCNVWEHGKFERFDDDGYAITNHGFGTTDWKYYSILNPYPDSYEAKAIELLRKAYDGYSMETEQAIGKLIREIDSYK